MGRITIFSLQECPHCKRVKSAFNERNIPYTDISLSTHPQKRSDMLSLADRLTVPQVFFNDVHIGGADDTLSLLTKWDDENSYTSPLERYKAEIESQGDPSDPRLATPTSPPVIEKPPPPRKKLDNIETPAGDNLSILQMMQTLIEIMPRCNLNYHGDEYKNCFKGSDGVKALMKHYSLEKEEDAVTFGRTLQSRGLLHHVSEDHTFGSSSKYFRLQAFHKPRILNSFRVWDDRVDPDAMSLLNRLKKMLGKIESKVTDKDGLVDYIAGGNDPDYWVFEEAVCELQGVSLATMDDKTKLAFGINLYNLMIKHAFFKLGTPSSTLRRNTFFNKVCYDVGGNVLSFSELENGILRANAIAPYQLCTPFSSSDARRSLALSIVDPRIHFGLNCGAKSCPPVKKFTTDAIEEELRIVAMAFCEQDDNVLVDETAGVLKLSMIFKWYSSDFASSTSKLPEKVVEYLRGEKKESLQRMIDAKSSISVKFFDYDWSTNASKSKDFSGSELKTTGVTVKSLLSIFAF